MHILNIKYNLNTLHNNCLDAIKSVDMKTISVNTNTINIEILDKKNKFYFHNSFNDIVDNYYDKKCCLYIFMIESENNKIIECKYNRFKKLTSMNCPKFNENNKNSTVLYIEKNKKYIKKRLAAHYGHYHVSNSGGMKLAFWAKGLNVNLKIYLYFFDENSISIIDSLEKQMRNELKPILGK